MNMSYFRTLWAMWDFTDTRVELAAFLSLSAVVIGSFAQNSLGISAAFFISMVVLMVFDFITGVAASLRRNIPISSSRGVRSIFKAGFYIIVLYALYTLRLELTDKIPFVDDVIRFLHLYLIAHMVFWELFSVDENLRVLGIDLGVTTTLKKAFDAITNLFNQDKKEK